MKSSWCTSKCVSLALHFSTLASPTNDRAGSVSSATPPGPSLPFWSSFLSDQSPKAAQIDILVEFAVSRCQKRSGLRSLLQVRRVCSAHFDQSVNLHALSCSFDLRRQRSLFVVLSSQALGFSSASIACPPPQDGADLARFPMAGATVRFLQGQSLHARDWILASHDCATP